MKKFLITILLSFFILFVNFFNLFSNTNINTPSVYVCHIHDSVDEMQAISDAVEKYYIGGIISRDFSLIRSICIEETKMYGIRKDGSLSSTTLDKWSEKFDPENPPFNSLDYQIEKVDFTGTAAQVKIRFIINGSNVVYDYLNMLKINNHWKIINIIDYWSR